DFAGSGACSIQPARCRQGRGAGAVYHRWWVEPGVAGRQGARTRRPGTGGAAQDSSGGSATTTRHRQNRLCDAEASGRGGLMNGSMSRRRFLGLLGGTAALSAAGWSLARPAVINPCRVAIPAALIDSPWLRQAWAGIDPAQVWDCHVHVAGLGDGGSGIVVGPQLSSALHPLHYAQRLFYMNAGCAHDAPGKVDQAYAARLLNLCDAMPGGFKVMLFAFESFYDERGRAHTERTAFYVPDAWAAKLARDFPERFEWVASIHPYRSNALDALQAAITDGVRAVKWLPAAMGMDPASTRCDAFYRMLATSGVPLIIHCGEEQAVKGGDSQAW